MGVCLLAGCALVGLGSADKLSNALAEPPAVSRQQASEDQIDGWIEQLGDDVYTVRQTAADRLLEAGAAARGPLLEVADGPDPEVRAAAKRLVALIDESEFQRRLSAFAADTDGRLGLSLPGWDAFRDLVGEDAAARQLFVDMQQEEGPLLDQMLSNKANVEGTVWESRLQRLLRRRAIPGRGMVVPSMGSCAAMFFLGSLEKVGVSDQAAMLLYQLTQRPPVRDALAGDKDGAARRVVAAWIVHCPNKQPNILRARLQLAVKNQLTEALPLALGVAQTDPEYLTVEPPIRAYAIMAVGKLGSREQAEQLEPLLEDEAVCDQAGVTTDATHRRLPEVQIRDVALAALLHLNNQDVKEYGFSQARRNPETLYALNTLGFSNDSERTQAIAKWRKWKSEHPPDSKGR